MVERCSHCGALTVASPFKSSKRKRLILECLQRTQGRYIQNEEIIAYAYADDPSGGPSGPSTVSSHIAQMRSVLHHQGLTIEGYRGPSGGYMLKELSQ